ncbi:uncharacterized protein B0I36DRAFT_326907 [Microdochium trichocladiopsis]|uniref:Uncharacterized protein n=1 Tax=Microdochium trichocladiopsis TaxID=1682393 RepID=A0A9P9BN44_9PEZI|nr:uncharacterized protein B0I36DRAFT_326907 [Microdochium trichocladiopsis]KAH7027338.1 hypothetical protein B0I36DRAFT_326907 [Microdochium trichocladiopsis]
MMARPRRSKAAVASDPEDASDHGSQEDTIGAVPRAMQNIDTLKKTRAQNQAGINQDYNAALDMWTKQVRDHFARQTQEMERVHTDTIARFTAAVERKLACEEAIAERIKALSEDRAHLAMLINAVYTGRRELARDAAATMMHDAGTAKTTGRTAKASKRTGLGVSGSRTVGLDYTKRKGA